MVGVSIEWIDFVTAKDSEFAWNGGVSNDVIKEGSHGWQCQ
jgi:hypothetical protein